MTLEEHRNEISLLLEQQTDNAVDFANTGNRILSPSSAEALSILSSALIELEFAIERKRQDEERHQAELRGSP